MLAVTVQNAPEILSKGIALYLLIAVFFVLAIWLVKRK